MASHRWLVLALSGILAACSGDDDNDACTPSNVIDDEEDVVNTTQALSASEQQALARTVEALGAATRAEAAARFWSEAPGNAERALVRDFVEAAWIDRDLDVVSRLAADPSVLHAGGQRSAATTVSGDRSSGWAAGGAEPLEAQPSYKALRRVIAGGDLVLAVSEGERDGAPYEFLDLLRVASGRIVERWSSARPSSGSAEPPL